MASAATASASSATTPTGAANKVVSKQLNTERVVKSKSALPHAIVYSYRLMICAFFKFADVPLPPDHRLTMAEVFDVKGKPNLERLKVHMHNEGRIAEDVALRIINDGAALLRKEDNVIDVEAPITG